ncbi:unnamed protein product [Coffea canephora]|uniref:Non-specific lipid-transfer protein n=2 Tax=Coffea TaxID=13442 RepID=A0A068UVN2_COFCA|nr:non-specific lipid-transfer protein C, cotyledon-specific isoform-like [Coffea arabica]CDP12600.1 unnamed protein product [Coffea canephora]
MKSLCFSMILILSLLFAVAHLSNAAAPDCGTVDAKAAACVSFARGKDRKPAAACCTGLQQLAQTVKNVNDKKAICRCLKTGVKSFPGVQDKYMSKIPAACRINVGFPISMNTNCEAIH